MRNRLTTVLLCAAVLVYCFTIAFAATSQLTFNWQQSASDLPNLKEWRIYKSTTQGSGYTLFNTITYNGVPAQEYTGSSVLTQPDNTKQVYYFVCRAVGNNGVESGNSNEVSATIDWTSPSVPILFRVTVTN